MADSGPLASIFPVKSSFPSRSKKENRTPESKHWRSFKSSQISGLVYPVTSIDYSPLPPHDFAFACSTSVCVYDSLEFVAKSISHSFSDLAYSPSFRSDGCLLAAGCHSGIIHVFNPYQHTFMRQLQSHARPAHVVRFPYQDKLHLFSAADDAMLNYWDVSSTGAPLLSFQAHKDYIRAGSPSPTSTDMFATGSYDHSISLWDVRSSFPSPVLNISHGKPVESVVFLPSGGLLASAGGNSIKIWDIISGGRLMYTLESHNKTVTALCLGKISGATDELRLLSVSLDGYMKIFDFFSFKVTHSMRFPAPLISIGCSPCGFSRVAGTSNGILYVGKRKHQTSSLADNDEKFSLLQQVMHPRSRGYFRHRQHGRPSEGDFVLDKSNRPRLPKHDRLLKKFHHKEALVSALRHSNPENIMAVIEELVARKKLLKSISNLDTTEVGLLLGFLHKYSTRPTYAKFLMSLAKKALQMRANDIRQSDELMKHAMNLRRTVIEEIKIQTSLLEMKGIISPLVKIAGRSTHS